MEQRSPYCRHEKKGHKRKQSEASSSPAAPLPEEDEEEEHDVSPSVCGLRVHLQILAKHFSWREADRAAAKRSLHALADLAKRDENIDILVEEGAVEALVQHLEAPLVAEGEGPIAYEHEVEKEAAFVLGLLALKREHQRCIADAGAIFCLVTLLKRFGSSSTARAVNGVIRRAADTLTNLAHENGFIKNLVRIEGGILPLVDLLESTDSKVQRAAAGALRTLAFKNEANKNQIVEYNALPLLILMLRSESVSIHSEAVGVIGNLVHSSANIKREVILAGALQPVIGLLSSRCPQSQKEAALLLGQFATTDQECKVHIVQRGAVRPLIKMLQSPDSQLRSMAAFALGRLAQNTHNQAGIVHDGGLPPLLELLDSRDGSLQHNAAFAIYGLADNEDNVYDIVKSGAVERLQDGELIAQQSKDCAAKTLKRLEEKIHGRILRHLLYLMRLLDRVFQRRIALALAHLCSWEDLRMIFIDSNGLDVLLGLLGPTANPKQQRDGVFALLALEKKAALSPMVAAPLPPPPQVYVGEQFVNNETLSDVRFVIEGRRFYAHRIALLASSDAFRAMFDGGYKEKEANDIEIPNISWRVFELMMRFLYTGTVEVTLEIAQDLLRASDQYLLEGLKRLCEECIAQDLTVENVADVFDLAEAHHAILLKHTCALFILKRHEQMCTVVGYSVLIQRIIPTVRDYMHRILTPHLFTP